MTELPRLLDVRGIMAETGLKRGTAESIMRELEKYVIGRRVFVKREHALAELEKRKVRKDGIAA